MTDEAHRSQYDVLALNMRNALPNAAFLAFTGTPLMVGEERTRQVFGDYVSIYNFKQSVEDNATVPLYYENRIPELQLTNENLNEDMQSAAGRCRAGRGAGSQAGARVRPRVPPDHPRRPPGEDRRRYRAALHGARLSRARPWWSRSTKPPPCACTTRCKSTGRCTWLTWKPNWRPATESERPELKAKDPVHARDRYGGGRLPGAERNR